MNNIPRVVLDTNVLISALVFGGKPRRIVEFMARGQIQVVVSEVIFTELRRKISQKFPAFADELKLMLLMLEEDAEVVRLGEATITVCRDPDDNHILETAVAGACDYVASGDKDLLSLGRYGKIRILNPAELLAAFN